MFLPVRILRATLRWSPVWIPAIFIWQIRASGLEPALVEKDRLAAAKIEVEERHAASSNEFERLQAEYEAWHDPTYRERRRRALRASKERGD